MASRVLRIGITGCGHAARLHLRRLLGLEGVRVVGCADPDPAAAEAMAGLVPAQPGESRIPAFTDHRELLRRLAPEALAVFTPHRAHYRPSMDALQSGCHVFIEKPLSTNPQEAVDIVNVARGRSLKVGVGHQYRLCPSLVEARRLLAEGRIGRVTLVSATLAGPWLSTHSCAENSWRFDPKMAGGGVLCDVGDHLIDALLWTTGQVASEAAAFQSRQESGLDLVTAAAMKLADGTPVTLGLSGVSPGSLFELTFFGAEGRLRASDQALLEQRGEAAETQAILPEPNESIDGNFVAALREDAPLCCPAEQAVETVRLLEAIARSAATGQVVRLA
jgi:predicted dehydrogenase